MSRRALLGPLLTAGVVALAAVHAWILPPSPTITTTAAWPTAANAVSVTLDDYLWVGARALDDDLIAWAEGDRRSQPWLLDDGRLQVALIEATPHAIRLGGEDVLRLDAGQVPAEDHRGKLVSRLYEALMERSEATRALEDRAGAELRHRRVLVAVDQDLPGRTLQQILFTTWQAALPHTALVVQDADAPAFDRNQRVPADARRADTPTFARAGCGVASLKPEGRVGREVSRIDALAALGMPRVSLAWEESRPRHGWSLLDHAPVARALSVDDAVAVLPVVSPWRSPYDDASPEGACLPDGGVAEHVTGVLGVLRDLCTPSGNGLGDLFAGGLGDLGHGLGGLGTQGLGQPSNPTPTGHGPAVYDPGVKLTVGEPMVLGALDRSLVTEVFRRYENQLRYCYEREQHLTGGVGDGSVTVKFVIAQDGTVSKADVQTTTLGSPGVEDCVVGRFLRMPFPSGKGGGIAIVRVPLTYERTDR